MSKSIHVQIVGQRQKYNLLDPEAVHRAQKALNQRITDIAETFGVDSQIYRDYVAPLRNDASSQFIRLDSKGRVKLKTGKGLQDSPEARAIVHKMLLKNTKGEILESTAEQIGGARNLRQRQKIKRDTGENAEIVSIEEILKLADEYHKMRSNMYSRLSEIYELAEQEGVDPRKGHLNRFKWYRELKASDGRANKELVEKANRSLKTKTNFEYLGLKPKTKVDRFGLKEVEILDRF